MAPFTRERNHSVPSLFQFLERKNTLFIRERNDCVWFLFLFARERDRFVPQFFRHSLPFFQQLLHPYMRLGQKSYRSIFWSSFAPHCLSTLARNGTIAHRSTFRINFYRPAFWNRTMSLQARLCERNPQAFHSSERNDMKRNDCIPL